MILIVFSSYYAIMSTILSIFFFLISLLKLSDLSLIKDSVSNSNKQLVI